jgi:cytochrome oxidase Cu insertion factor (SCO1/SenC/PrrC family)
MIKNILLACVLSLLYTQSCIAADTVNFQFVSIQGTPFKLSDYKGRWVIVNFLAPWCPMCWAETATLNKMNSRPDVVVIGITMDYGQDEMSAKAAIISHGLNFDKYVFGGNRRDQNAAFRQVGPVDFFPTSYVYDPSGNVVMFIPGQFRESSFLNFMLNHK